MDKPVLDPFPVLREVPELLNTKKHFRYSVVRTYPTTSKLNGMSNQAQNAYDPGNDWTEYDGKMVQALTLADAPTGEKKFTFKHLGTIRNNLIERLQKIMADMEVLRKNDSEHLYAEIKSSQPGLSKQGRDEWVHGVLLATARNAENYIESLEYITHIMNTILKFQEFLDQKETRRFLEGEVPGSNRVYRKET